MTPTVTPAEAGSAEDGTAGWGSHAPLNSDSARLELGGPERAGRA